MICDRNLHTTGHQVSLTSPDCPEVPRRREKFSCSLLIVPGTRRAGCSNSSRARDASIDVRHGSHAQLPPLSATGARVAISSRHAVFFQQLPSSAAPSRSPSESPILCPRRSLKKCSSHRIRAVFCNTIAEEDFLVAPEAGPILQFNPMLK